MKADINRRTFLAALASIPVLERFVPAEATYSAVWTIEWPYVLVENISDPNLPTGHVVFFPANLPIPDTWVMMDGVQNAKPLGSGIDMTE